MVDTVYILTNPAMPGFVKIGRTSVDDMGIRLAQLYTTGVPFPFDVAYAVNVENSVEVERALHFAFGPSRVNPKREFFKIEAEQAIVILKLLDVEDATQRIEDLPSTIPNEEVQAATDYKSRQPNFNFREMGIPINAILQAVDRADIATVIGDRRVTFRGLELSLTAATKLMLAVDYSPRPAIYWTYDGRILLDIYRETYSSGG